YLVYIFVFQHRMRCTLPLIIADEQRGVVGSIEILHHGEPSWSSAKERRRLVQLFRDEVVEIPMGVRDQDFRGAGLQTSFDRRVSLLGHQAATLLVRLASLGWV